MRRFRRAFTAALLLGCSVALGVALLLGIGLLAVRPPALAPAAAPQPWDVALTMSEAFLTARLREGGGTQTIQLKEPLARFQGDGTVVITGLVSRAGGGTVPLPRPPGAPGGPTTSGDVAVEIVLRPGIKDGKLATDVVRAQFGPLPVPERAADLLEGPLNSRIAGAVGGGSFRLVAVSVRQGQLAIQLKRA